MKRTLAIILALAMVFCLCACGAAEKPASAPAANGWIDARYQLPCDQVVHLSKQAIPFVRQGLVR